MNSSKKIALILLVAAVVLIPTVAILHAIDTPSNSTTGHDDDHHDQDQNHQDHDDNETSDDHSIAHDELDDENENEAAID